MSYEAVSWAMDDAPMLKTSAGKPDVTARHVLQAVAEHADKDGANAHPSILRIQYRTGMDRTTAQRALRRLEQGGLLIRDGSVSGRARWRLPLDLRRPETDWKELEGREEAARFAASERQRKSRAGRVTGVAPVTVTDSTPVTTVPADGPPTSSHGLNACDVTDSASVCHGLNAAQTINEPPVEPPTKQASKPATPGQPDWALPLIHAVHNAGLPGLRWKFPGDEWFIVHSLIKAKGVAAMAAYAIRAAQVADGGVVSARYFLAGWKELPDQPPTGTEPPVLRPVDAGPPRTRREREQQEVDSRRARQMARARERNTGS